MGASERRGFVFFLHLSLTTKAVFQELLGQILAADSKRYRKPEHDSSERDSERQDNGLISYPQFFRNHREDENDDDRARRDAEQARRGKIRVDGGQQDRPREKAGNEQSKEQDEQGDKKPRYKEEESFHMFL